MTSSHPGKAKLTHRASGFGPLTVLTALTIGAALLRIHHLGQKPFWFDEVVVYGFSQASASRLISVNAQNNFAPPLFVFVIHYLSLLGTSEFTLRLFSWLAGVACVPAIYLLARRYLSTGAALICSFLVAAATVQLEYSQQLREYSLTFLLSCLLLLAYSLYAETRATKHWFFMVLTAIVALWSQYGLALLVLATNLMAALRAVKMQNRRGFIVGWGLAQLCIGVAALAVYLTTLRYQFRVGYFGFLERGYWNGQIAELPVFLYGQTYEIILFSFPESALFILALATGVVARLVARESRPFVIELSLPFVVAAAAGMLRYYPYVGTRHGLYLTPIVYLLAGMGFDYLLAAPSKRIVAIVLLSMLARGALIADRAYLQSEGLENIRPIVEVLSENLLPNDQVFVCEGAIPAFNYYFHLTGARVTRSDPGEGWQDQLDRLIATGDRLWLVVTHCGDRSTYTNYITARSRTIEEAESAYQAWLYLSR